ncbi:helix-loop-helix DNA-binding domain-containing protein [Xylariaceae sp. FL0804]|nr:helix-loop-helix DNA-binding domain-containing protein [Xylariaceae sp. FL0804]
MDPGAWHIHDQNMASGGDDDFRQFIDMGAGMSSIADSMLFEFEGFPGHGGDAMMQPSRGNGIDTPMSDPDMQPVAPQGNNMGMQNPMSASTSMPNHSAVPSQAAPVHQLASDAIDAQLRYWQQQKLLQQQQQLQEGDRRLRQQHAALYAHQQGGMVPPTPQSIELSTANRFFAPSQEQPHSSGTYEGYAQMKEQQDMAFTPLVSPAVTPLDLHFNIDPHFIPAPYLSPITSPALHAQYESTHPMQATAIPSTGMDIESSPAPMVGNPLSKNPRKNSMAKKKQKVSQSPIAKPQKKNKSTTPNMRAQRLGELASLPEKSSSIYALSTDESEDASVSPEALEMPPPPLPLPRSARQSPVIPPESSGGPGPVHKSVVGKPSPATPATLLRFSPGSTTVGPSPAGQINQDVLDNLELPEPVSLSKPSKPQRISPNIQPARPLSAGLEKGGSASFQPIPSPTIPSNPQAASAGPSPQITPRAATPNSRKTPVLAPKTGRKRASIVGTSSPALLPRISPSIKPLLPGTPALASEDTASLLLASKSNYQRILEGNTMPGVTYPSELSTNLTSKRTSHKIAEQGRRQRINSALEEIGALLPKDALKDAGEGSGDSCGGDKKNGNKSSNPNSKASTVELAIDYIKQLQGALADANKRADAAEARLAQKSTEE